MKKPHLTPISSNFSRSQNITIEYTDRNHFIQFDCNSISFKPLIAWEEQEPGNSYLIFQNFQAILRTYNEKHFHKLRLNFYEWYELDTVVLRRLGSEIGKHFRNLQELSFHFFSCSRITETGLQHLISPISRHLKGLRALSLSVTGSTPVNEKGANFLRSSLLKRVKNLSKLNLIFSGENIDIGEERYPFEADVLTRLKRLQLADSVDYLQSKDTSKAALQICRSARYCLRNLQQIVLINSNDCNISILNTVSFVLRRVRKLQVLYLGFLDNYRDGGHNKIKEISSYLSKNLSNLRYLTFSLFEFEQIRIKDMIFMLGYTLSCLPVLRGFTLSASHSEKIIDEELLLVVDQICLHGKHLESLTLDFEGARNITSPALEQVTHALSQHLVNLKELILNFRFAKNRWNEDPVPFISFSSLVRLHLYLPTNDFSINLSGCAQHLEELTLSFDDCRQISGGEFENLVAPLFSFELQGIRQLNLLLLQAEQIQDEDIGMLRSCNWNCMPNLKEFTLSLSYAETITDRSLVFISELVKTELKRLSTLKLSFRECSLFTENAFHKLSRTIVENMKQLNDLELDFPTVSLSQKVIDLIITEIANYAKKLKKIRIYFFTGISKSDFIVNIRNKLSFVPVVDFYC